LIKRIVIAMLLALATFSSPVVAASRAETAHFLIQETIEKRIMLLMHRYDKEALVFVTVALEKSANELPSTPFTVEKLALSDADEPRVKSIKVTIHTTLKPMPEDLLKVLTSTVDKFGVKPQFEFVDLPAVAATSEETALQTPGTPEAEAAAPGSVENLKQLVYKNPLLTLIALMIVAVAACAVVFVALFFRVSLRNWRAIDQGFKSVASSFGEAAGGPVDRNAPAPALAEASQRRDTSSLDRGETFKALSVESLRALLADCYWGQFDTYAAFVWYRVPVEKRTQLLAKDKYLTAYVGTLSGIDEQDLGLEQEPYYLNPLPINHLDSEALTELARGEPRLLKLLPTLRLDSLHLTVAERIALLGGERGAPSEGKPLPNFERIAPSALRALLQRSKFKIHSVDEELEVLAMRDLTVDVCREIPTLGWLAEIDSDKLREIFLGYTAQDLASAWIGPDSVLKAMAASLPEKKLKLVLTYRERMQPSRDSRTFQMLHAKSLEMKFGDAAKTGEANAAPTITAA
jgi:hypothetical protein